MGDPALSAIILNYNGLRWLPACFGALAEQRGAPAFETLLVDNDSTDESVAHTRAHFPSVRVIETGENLGFSQGNNAGAREARGRWLVFLNNDTIPDQDWLAKLAAAADAHPAFDLFTSRIVYMDDARRIDSAGDGYLRAGGAFKHGHGADAGAFLTPRETFGACGAAFMIRREVFESLGGFDARFFMFYEDVDLSYRARLRGYRVWYASDAIVRHAGSASAGHLSAAMVYYGQRNLEWTWIKNTPASLLAATALSHLVYSLAGVAHYIRSGRGGAAIRGKLAAIAGLPASLRDRRRIQASRVVDAAALEAVMERSWIAVKRREKAFDESRGASRP